MTSLYRQFVSDFWTTVFKDQAFVKAVLAHCDGLEEQTLSDADYALKSASRRELPGFRSVKWRQITIYESDILKDPRLFDDGAVFDSGAVFDEAGPADVFFMPVDPDVAAIGFIMDDVAAPSVAWQNGVDFRFDLSARGVYARLHPSTAGFKRVPLPGRSGPEPESGFRVWARGVSLDRGDLRRLYADTVRVLSGEGAYYKRLVNALWNLRVDGCTLLNLRAALSAVADSDVALEAGTVADVFEEAGRLWVRVDDALWSAPDRSSAIVSVGDRVSKGALLFGSVAIYSPEQTIPRTDVPGLHLGKGFMGAAMEGGGLLVENKDLPFPEVATLVMSNVEGSRYLVEDGSAAVPEYLARKEGYVDVELLVEDAGEGVEYRFVDARLNFPFKGDPDSVAAFRTRLAELAAELGGGLGDEVVARNYGKPPDTVNLFNEYRRAMGRNLLLVRIDTSCVPPGVDPADHIENIRLSVPARAAMVSHMDSSQEDSRGLAGAGESLTAFLLLDSSDDRTMAIQEATNSKVSL